MPKSGEKRQALNESKEPPKKDKEEPSSEPKKKKEKQKTPFAGATSSEKLHEQAQFLVDEINVKRKNDNTMLSDFRKQLETQTETWCASLDETMIKIYEKNSKTIQEKLQELYATLDRIGELEQELTTFRASLSMLYNDIRVEE